MHIISLYTKSKNWNFRVFFFVTVVSIVPIWGMACRSNKPVFFYNNNNNNSESVYCLFSCFCSSGPLQYSHISRATSKFQSDSGSGSTAELPPWCWCSVLLKDTLVRWILDTETWNQVKQLKDHWVHSYKLKYTVCSNVFEVIVWVCCTLKLYLIILWVMKVFRCKMHTQCATLVYYTSIYVHEGIFKPITPTDGEIKKTDIKSFIMMTRRLMFPCKTQTASVTKTAWLMQFGRDR